MNGILASPLIWWSLALAIFAGSLPASSHSGESDPPGSHLRSPPQVLNVHWQLSIPTNITHPACR
ncbi:hypothetical protein FKP32DRAFT_1596343 [Trametes sanguinea]|nr:hypothetical protein FKP32DRAFT_1596343 [Trametes sanguinea]